MEAEQLINAIGNYGFPMIVSCYLLIRMETKIEKLSNNIEALARVLAADK